MDDETLDRLLDGERCEGSGGAVARLLAVVGSASPGEPGTSAPELTPHDLASEGFRTIGLLGSGTHATVWDAQDTTLGRRVALKVVRARGTDPGAQRTFLREARMLARVDHPNVLRIWSAERSDERLVLVLERLEGRTLRELVMSDGPLDARAAARIVLDVARGLSAVHAAGVLHRDLHPGNVMLRRDGSAVLLDFSLARGGGAHRLQRGGTVGTPAYEAPEVLRGGEPSERSDVYSLGMLFLWLATGRTPLRGETWSQLRAAAVAGDRAPLAEIAPGMPRELRAVVERAIRVDPAERTPDASILAHQLSAALGRRRRRAALALGLALAVGVAGGALDFVRRARSSSRAEESAQRDLKQLEGKKAQQELSRLEFPSPPQGLAGLAGVEPWDPQRSGFDGPQIHYSDAYASIQEAVRDAIPRGVVWLPADTYTEVVELADVSVAIASRDGPGAAVFDGAGLEGSVIRVQTSDSNLVQEVVLWGLSITGGLGNELNHTKPDGPHRYGGGVFVQGAELSVRLEACELWGNGFGGATLGGGLAVRNSLDGKGVVTLVDCLIVRNAAWDGGAILADKARVTLERCIVADNFSGGLGGTHGGIALANDSELEVRDSKLWGNRCEQIGVHRHAETPSAVWHVDRSLVQASEAQMLGPSPFLDAESMDYRLFGPERELRGPPHQSWARRIDASPRGVESLGVFSAEALRADTKTVSVPGDFPTIQAAIDGAPPDAVVLIGPGVYYELLTIKDRSLTLVGEFGASATVLDVSHVDGPVIEVFGPVQQDAPRQALRIQGLTLRGGNGRVVAGRGRFGGALAVSGQVDLDLVGVVLWESGLEASTNGGGGLWAAEGARVRAQDCLFALNHASGRGAALLVDGAEVDLEHCTVVGSDAAVESWIHVAADGRLRVARSVLWCAAGAVMIAGPDLGRIEVSHSLIRGGWGGPGALEAEPGFIDPANSDWRRAPTNATGADWGFRTGP